MFEYICGKYGCFDIFVNNVVVNLYFGYIFDIDFVVYEKIVDVNICGYFFMLVEVGKLMKMYGGGVIVNMVLVNVLQLGDW